MMRASIRMLIVAAGAASVGCHNMGSTSAGATAELRTPAGVLLGTLSLAQASDGVHIIGRLTGAAAGMHGIHFHQVGRCDAPDFASAGAHVNPMGRKHGLSSDAGPHLGDLPNVSTDASGATMVELVSNRVTLDSAPTTGLLDADGAAIVLHAGADDQRTDPSGGSGARIACGVIHGS